MLKLFPSPEAYNWREYRKLLDKAIKYEKIGDLAQAMDIYIQIIDDYVPYGVEYYERPAKICEKLGEYEAALYFCRFALLNHLQCEDEIMSNEVLDKFEPWAKSLARKLGKDEEKVLYFTMD